MSKLLTGWVLATLAILLAPSAAMPEEGNARPGTDGMIFIPGGRFLMGTDVAEGERPSNESPQHPAEVRSYFISRYEVSNREFERFIAAKGYETEKYWSEDGWKWLEDLKRPRADGEAVPRTRPAGWEARKVALGDEFPGHPVTGVSWFEADAYARFVGKRLPTEIEWERAARGTDGRTYPWGNEIESGLREIDPDEKGPTRPVGSNPADVSAEGVFDMGANVAEWTSSWYDGYPGTKFVSRYFGEDARRRLKIARGGSWRSVGQGVATAAHECRTSYREYQYSYRLGHAQIGFRLAMDEKAE